MQNKFNVFQLTILGYKIVKQSSNAYFTSLLYVIRLDECLSQVRYSSW